MSEKVGPYGSHYGQGCYTKECSLRHASEAGISRPPTYETTDQAYTEAHSRYMTAKGATDTKNRRAILDEAKVKRNATVEGLKELKKELPRTKALFGNSSLASILKEEEIQNAQNLYDQQETAFKTEVFKANPKLAAKDLRSLVEHSARYSFDKKTNAIMDTKKSSTLVKVNDDGSLLVTENGTLTLIPATQVKEYATAREAIAIQVAEDVALSVGARPTINSKISNVLEASYMRDKPLKNLDGSYTVVVRDKKNDSPLARFKYDQESLFDSAEWASARDDGSLTWPEKSTVTILHMLQAGSFSKFPPLPAWIHTA